MSDGGSGSSATRGQRVSVAGREALLWGEGAYGVVLAHGVVFDAASWEPQAVRIAAAGMVVVAVEDIAAESILAAAEYLVREHGADRVALVGGSAGADAILRAVSDHEGLAHQLILLSPNRVVGGLGTEPKLFVASEDEPAASVALDLAREAPGTENEALILPGGAHAQHIFGTDQGEPAMRAILERLQRFAAGE